MKENTKKGKGREAKASTKRCEGKNEDQDKRQPKNERGERQRPTR